MDENCRELRYPVGIQSFSEIIGGGYVYVDKTALVHRLMREGKYYFLSRPRRFGKSLLLSTIEAYYLGRRDLFRGLALDSLTDDWEPHPVLHIDLNPEEYTSEESLRMFLDDFLKSWETRLTITQPAYSIALRFGDVIRRAYESTGKKVVILIDEYDKPMLAAINDTALADRFRSMLKAFYGNIKSLDECIEFAMLTGVARFSKVSIFSDLNNLRDISFEPEFSAICGMTDEEIDRYFSKGIECLADANGLDCGQTRQRLRVMYDGYHFARKSPGVYNPFSLVNVFSTNEFGNYWYMTGTPTYLIELMLKHNWELQDLERCTIDTTELASEGIMRGETISTLYQTGYLTIKGYDPDFDQYVLGYPNREVKLSFLRFLRPYYLGIGCSRSEFDIKLFVNDVREGRPRDFMTRLGSLLRGIPHIGAREPRESHFQNAVYLIFRLMSFHTRMEDHTSNGRIDISVVTDRFVYVFEFKVDASAHEALRQIRRKEYWRKFEASGKTVFIIGANFDTKTNTLDDFIIEKAL